MITEISLKTSETCLLSGRNVSQSTLEEVGVLRIDRIEQYNTRSRKLMFFFIVNIGATHSR